MRLVYSYSMKGEPDRVRTVAPEHAAYWDDLEVPPTTSAGRTPVSRAA
jgi:hypothetical protein